MFDSAQSTYCAPRNCSSGTTLAILSILAPWRVARGVLACQSRGALEPPTPLSEVCRIVRTLRLIGVGRITRRGRLDSRVPCCGELQRWSRRLPAALGLSSWGACGADCRARGCGELCITFRLYKEIFISASPPDSNLLHLRSRLLCGRSLQRPVGKNRTLQSSSTVESQSS